MVYANLTIAMIAPPSCGTHVRNFPDAYFDLLACTTMLAACGGAGPQTAGSAAPPSGGGGTGGGTGGTGSGGTGHTFVDPQPSRKIIGR